MRSSIVPVLLFVVTAAGCTDSSTRPAVDSGASLDGRVDDASSALDAAAVDGGAAPSDAATALDAGRTDAAAVVDASTRDGGGTGTSPVEVCEVLCEELEACFTSSGGGPDAKCVEQCSADLADCSAAQRMTLLACGDDGCAMGGGAEPAIATCIAMVGCVDMEGGGGGEPLPPPMPRP